jgi:hypothetical protein
MSGQSQPTRGVKQNKHGTTVKLVASRPASNWFIAFNELHGDILQKIEFFITTLGEPQIYIIKYDTLHENIWLAIFHWKIHSTQSISRKLNKQTPVAKTSTF